MTKELVELRRCARSLSPRALERVAQLMESADEKIALEASKVILDRAGLVPPKIAIDMGETPEDPSKATAKATVAEMLQVVNGGVT